MSDIESPLKKMHGNYSEVPKGMNIMAVMGADGDTKHLWDSDKPEEVQAAKEVFNTLVKEKKYTAFMTNKKGGKGDGPVKEFDPSAGAYLFIPQMRGG